MPLPTVWKSDLYIHRYKWVWRHLMYCWLIDIDAGYMRVALWYTHKDAVLNFCDVGTSGFCLSFLLLSSLLIISRVCHVANSFINYVQDFPLDMHWMEPYITAFYRSKMTVLAVHIFHLNGGDPSVDVNSFYLKHDKWF